MDLAATVSLGGVPRGSVSESTVADRSNHMKESEQETIPGGVGGGITNNGFSSRQIKFLYGWLPPRAFLWAALFLGAAFAANGAVIRARSASLNDVAAAVQAAVNGDTVAVPAGTATWTAPLTITKNITLQGAGVGSTIILDGITGSARSATGAGIISVVLTRDAPVFQLSGFEFGNGPGSKSGRLSAEVSFKGGSASTQSPAPMVVGESVIRMDHCKFRPDLQDMPAVFRDVIGIVDHVERTGPNVFAQVYMQNWNGSGLFYEGPYSCLFVFIRG